MRIFIGLREIANIVFTYAKGFHISGHETYTAVLCKSDYYLSSEYDEVLERVNNPQRGMRLARAPALVGLIRRWLSLLTVFLKALRSCDTFIFVFGTSFLPWYWDYRILKMLRKRIVSVFLGSDIRYWYSFEQETRSLGWQRELKPYVEYLKLDDMDFFATKIQRVRMAERYADLILSHPDMGQLQTRPFMCIKIPLDLSQYRFHIPDRAVPLILHVPSRRGSKGTSYVLAAMDQLRQEGIPFEFQLIEGLPNDQVRELLAEADIVVDQLFGSTLATLALEAMATGNVVLTRYDSSYAHIPSDCPAIKVTMYTLADQLRRVILNRDLRRQLAHAGRKYVEKYHSHVKVVQQILDWLNSEAIQTYDFVPTFFQNDFVMPDELLKEEHLRRKQQPRRIIDWLFWPLRLCGN